MVQFPFFSAACLPFCSLAVCYLNAQLQRNQLPASRFSLCFIATDAWSVLQFGAPSHRSISLVLSALTTFFPVTAIKQCPERFSMDDILVTVLILGMGGNVSQGILKALARSNIRCRIIGACTSAGAVG